MDNRPYTMRAVAIARNILKENGITQDSLKLALTIIKAVTGHIDYPAEPEPRVYLPGFQIINDMTNEEMLEEALAFQRNQWGKASRNQLKQFIVEARLHHTKLRLMEEAQFENNGFGFIFGGGNGE